METGAFRDSVARTTKRKRRRPVRRSGRAGIAELGRVRLRYLTGDGVTDADARARRPADPVFVCQGPPGSRPQTNRLIFNVELTLAQWNAAGAQPRT